MKKSIKLWLLIAGTLIVAGIAAICYITFLNAGSAAGKPSDSQPISGNETARKTIVFSYGGNDPGGSMKADIDAFEKAHPEIRMKVQQLPNSTDYQRNFYKRALYSGDTSIDVFYSDIIWTAEFAANDWVLPLDGYFDETVQKEFLQNSLEGCKYKGILYAMPHRTDVPLLYYRSDIVRTPPKTYKELVELSQKYTKKNGLKYGLVFQGQAYEGLVCNVLEFIWNNGGEVTSDGKVIINSPQAIGGLQALIDIVNSGVATPDVFNFQEEDARIAFQDGNALFMRNWPYAYNQLASDSSKVKGKFGIAPLPLGPDGKTSHGTLGGWNLMINKNTRNLDEALLFTKFMTSHEIEVLDCSTGGYLPARKAAYGDPKVQEKNPWIKGFMGQFENANLRPVSPSYSSISSVMQTNFSAALHGRIIARQAIENIEKALVEMDKEKSRGNSGSGGS